MQLQDMELIFLAKGTISNAISYVNIGALCR